MTNQNILLLTRYGHPEDLGGVANAIKNIVSHAVNEGFNFYIFSVRRDSLITPKLIQKANYGSEQIHLKIIPSMEGFGARKNNYFEKGTDNLADTILKMLPDKNFDLVHVITAYPHYARVGEKLSERLNIPYIISARGTDVYGHNPEYNYEPDKTWFLKPLKNSALITVLSDFQLENMTQNLKNAGYTHAIIKKVHNGVDPNYFMPLEKTGIPDKAIRAVYTGRIRKFKGVIEIIKAVHKAIESGADIKLNIYGAAESDKDNGAFNEIQRYINSNNLSNSIKCNGKYVLQSNLPEIYRKHNLLIHASYCEGHSNSVMEAMACGLPVVLNYASGSSDLLDDNELILETGNINQMAMILCYLADNPKKLAENGKRNRQFAIDHHWKKIAQEYCEIYREVNSKIRK